jgi:tRNA dimethylallyltransferase
LKTENHSEKQKIIILQGPTGVGKSAVALDLARAISAEIINADSMQFYRHMDIGTAKPAPQELSAIPHHLFSVVNPDEQYNAARFMREAGGLIADISRRGRVPLLVGGTGLYIRALTRGLSSAPPADEALRKELLSIDKEGLYKILQNVDPEAAAHISCNDSVRIVRAIEVYRITGETLSQHNLRHRFQDQAYACLKLCLTRNRGELYALIEARVERMIEAGLISEVENLFALGYGPELRPLCSIGYKQIAQYIRGGLSLAEAVSLIQRDSRHFAKRQLTWLRHDPENVWIELPGGAADVARHAKKFLNLD